MGNIFGFEETEKMGLRKGVVFYFNDWIDEKIISILEEIIEPFLSLTQAQFTKKYNGENSAYVNRRNIRGGWLKGEAREYQEKLRLDGEQYREFSETANCLFDAQRLDVDCRFSFFSV